MKKLNLRKIIAIRLITTSLVGGSLLTESIGASADELRDTGTWKYDSTGFWYQKQDGSYPKGWYKVVNTWYYFDTTTGYMKTGWIKDNDNWYYFTNQGMVSGIMFLDNKLSQFDGNGVWKGYVLDSNQRTISDSNDNFTAEVAKQIVQSNAMSNIEVTNGGYNGLPIEDKIYTVNNGTEDVPYRIVGGIDKTTGNFWGVFRVFKNGIAEEYPRGNNLILSLDGNSINLRTFDRNGSLLRIDAQTGMPYENNVVPASTQYNGPSNNDSEEIYEMITNPEYRRAHQSEYDRIMQQKSN